MSEPKTSREALDWTLSAISMLNLGAHLAAQFPAFGENVTNDDCGRVYELGRLIEVAADRLGDVLSYFDEMVD